jgi:phosphinothricin acetyltransferase
VAVPSDAAPIATIYNTYVRRRGSNLDTIEMAVDHFVDKIKDDREVLLVAERDGAVVAWARLFPWNPKPGYRLTAETSIYVADGFNGRGLGSALKTALIEAARARGLHHLIARVFAGNQASIELNERFGYRRVGVQKEVGVVDGAFIDIVIFELLL